MEAEFLMSMCYSKNISKVIPDIPLNDVNDRHWKIEEKNHRPLQLKDCAIIHIRRNLNWSWNHLTNYWNVITIRRDVFSN